MFSGVFCRAGVLWCVWIREPRGQDTAGGRILTSRQIQTREVCGNNCAQVSSDQEGWSCCSRVWFDECGAGPRVGVGVASLARHARRGSTSDVDSCQEADVNHISLSLSLSSFYRKNSRKKFVPGSVYSCLPLNTLRGNKQRQTIGPNLSADTLSFRRGKQQPELANEVELVPGDHFWEDFL